MRHGESEANREGRFASHIWDPPLTDTGRRQAEELAAQWRDAPVRHLVTSPLARAQQTIAPLSRILGIEPVILADLAEVNLGKWDGKRLTDLERAQSDSFSNWRRDPEQFPPPGGERILEVGRRVLNALSAFIAGHEPGLIIAASHADCLKGALLVVMNATGPAARRIAVPNTGQMLLRQWDTNRWTLVLSPLRYP